MSRRSAFSMVEVILAMTILALLTAVILNTYRGQLDRSKTVVCLDRLNAIRDVIDQWQLEHKRPWFRPKPPFDAPTDPWTQEFRVDARTGRIWSLGPDGAFQTPEEAGDLQVAYAPYPTGPVGRPRHVRGRPEPGGGFRIFWDWPSAQGAAVAYRIRRAARPGGPFSVVGSAPPEEDPSYVDRTAPDGGTVYYQVEAVLGPGATGPGTAPSKPYALTIPRSSLPGLELEAGSTETLAGQPLQVRVEGTPHGAALETLRFDEEVHPVGPGAFSRVFSYLPPGPGEHELEVRLSAVDGEYSVKTLAVTAR